MVRCPRFRHLPLAITACASLRNVSHATPYLPRSSDARAAAARLLCAPLFIYMTSKQKAELPCANAVRQFSKTQNPPKAATGLA